LVTSMKCHACDRELPEEKLGPFTQAWCGVFLSVRWFYWLIGKEYFRHGFKRKYAVPDGALLCSRCRALVIGIGLSTVLLFAIALTFVFVLR